MRRIAITGVSGYVGGLLLNRLDAHPEVESIIGIDNRPTKVSSKKLRFFLRDVSTPFTDLFAREGVDAAVHLAFVVRPERGHRRVRQVNVQGTVHFIEACERAGVQHILYFGSTSAYGAHPDNPALLTEDSPLRPNLRFQYSKEKAETDRMVAGYAAAGNGFGVTLLRGCVVLGPQADSSIGSRLFQPIMLRVGGFDPQVQYVHEEDVIDLMVGALETRLAGVFNVAGDGVLRYSEVARLARRPMLALPRSTLATIMDVTWACRLQGGSTSAGLDFITYPWVASNERLKKETGFSFRYSSEDAIIAYLGRGRE